MSTALVIVHGAGKAMSDFYKKPLADLTAVLGQEPPCLPCWYGDLSNIGAPVSVAADPEAVAFRKRFVQQLKEQSDAIAGEPTADERSFDAVAMGATLADLVADVTRYLYDATLQEPMRLRCKEALDKAAAFDRCVVVSHSLGTVLAYDVLREHAASFHVSHFITMGCPLKKVVKAGARSNDVGAITPDNVGMWRNLYDTRDPVADPIGPVFPGYVVEDVFTQAGTALLPAHDYWRRDNVVRMIAGYLR